MIYSLAIIIMFGLIAECLFEKLNLPGLLGMLLLGILIGPYALNIIDKTTIEISSDLRKIALIIILLRAGLGISKTSLKSIGKIAFKMSFIPGLLEGFTIAFISTKLLKITFIEGGILGFIIAAVSPAVVVPLMLKFMDKGYGKNKSIPTLILASASIDDVFAITIFSSFVGLYGGSKVNLGIQLLGIPISIILGIVIGLVFGFVLSYLFNRFSISINKSTLLLLAASFFAIVIENKLKETITIAGLLGVMAIGFILRELNPKISKQLSFSLNKIWEFAKILLFVLVGAEVNIKVAIDAGIIGLIIIFTGLIARSIGVLLSTANSHLTTKERLFCVISYTPKATVQAAIGAIPLSLGIPSGEVILALAVLSILVTAPLGAIGIRFAGEKYLEKADTAKLKVVSD